MAHHSPDRAAFLALARPGQVAPVWREVVCDGDTPVSAYQKLGRAPGGFLLESVVGGAKWAAYSFLGVRPRAHLTVGGGTARLAVRGLDGAGDPPVEAWACADPAAALERLLARYPASPEAVQGSGLPRFWGGAVGYLAYDAVRAWEPVGPRERELPDASFALTDTLVIFDNFRQTVRVVATALPGPPPLGDGDPDAAYDGACHRIDEIVHALERPIALRPIDLAVDAGPLPPSRTTRAGFEAAVRRIQEHILAGDAFQVVLSQRFEVPRAGADPFDAYRALRVQNPSPYLFHLDWPEAAVTGASPETLVRLEGRRIEVRPIAGTRPRGTTPEDDARLEAELRADEKENAEHVMLIDLGRNDVGRVAKMGSVRVEQARAVERYSHVMHLVSLVSGELAGGRTALDVLRAAFPAGTLTGAPKVRAMQILDALEPVARGVYGGAVGYLGFPVGGHSNLDLAIAIRTLVTIGDQIWVQAGAGIVHDSRPEAEYEETLAKARAALRAVAAARAIR